MPWYPVKEHRAKCGLGGEAPRVSRGQEGFWNQIMLIVARVRYADYGTSSMT